MDKLRLTVDDLAVQTFATTSTDPAVPGTVHAHADTDLCFTRAPANTCADGWTCVYQGCYYESFFESCGCGGGGGGGGGGDTWMCGPFWGDTQVASAC